MEVLKDIVKDKCLDSNILLELCVRNIVVVIGFVVFNIMKKYGDGVMCVYLVDYYIKDEKEFKFILEKVIYIVENNDKLVIIGIIFIFLLIGYGYINFNRENIIEDVVYEVVEFVEKLNYEIVKEYVNFKKYVWNSGMFVWKVFKILEDFKRYLLKVYEKLEDISKYLGIKEEMEKIKEIYLII